MTAQINPTVMERFRRVAQSGHLAHAYLLVGPQGCGKTQTALAIAQLVNCQAQPKPCGECLPCRKITSGHHPDIHIIGHEDTGAIKIEDIRFLLSRAHLRPYEADIKVFIIRNIELMTPEAANALLKTLEEPAARTLMVLTTSVPEDSLDTVKSRCHIVKFFAGEEAVAYDRKVLDEMLFNRHNDTFLKELSQSPPEASRALRLALSFLKDVLLLKSGAGKGRLRPEYAHHMEPFSRRSFEDITKMIQQIVAAKRLLDENLSVRMSLSLLREYVWAG